MNEKSDGRRVPKEAAARTSPAKRVLFGTAYAAVLLGATLGLVETAYRGQWVDTYRPELRAYNPPEVLAGGVDAPALLALGDSFTAGTASYPGMLATLLPGWRIVNGGLPGTGIVQANAVAPRRLREFRPSVCVYQLFAGNDLFDVRYPTRGPGLSPARRLYWFLAARLRSLAFLNYRLGQWRARVPTAYAPDRREPVPDAAFDPERYDPRERLYLAAEPALLDNHMLVRPERARDYERLLAGLAELRESCRRTNTRLVLLAIPHAAQVAPVYRERMRMLGAAFGDPDRMEDHDYPFLAGIRQAFADDPDVRIVDPLPDLQALERNGIPVYFANDGHLNRAGQECVARALAARLEADRPAEGR